MFFCQVNSVGFSFNAVIHVSVFKYVNLVVKKKKKNDPNEIRPFSVYSTVSAQIT